MQFLLLILLAFISLTTHLWILGMSSSVVQNGSYLSECQIAAFVLWYVTCVSMLLVQLVAPQPSSRIKNLFSCMHGPQMIICIDSPSSAQNVNNLWFTLKTGDISISLSCISVPVNARLTCQHVATVLSHCFNRFDPFSPVEKVSSLH